MALTSSNSYDNQTYALLALISLSIIGYIFTTMRALTALCAKCMPVSHVEPVPMMGESPHNTKIIARTQKRIGINVAMTQLWTGFCGFASDLVLMFVLLEYVGFSTLYGRNFRDNWTNLAIVIRLQAILFTFWFRTYDRPRKNMEHHSRLQCLNNSAWTMWVVGLTLTMCIVWIAVHSIYVLYYAKFCKDSGTGIMCSDTGTIVPYSITAATVVAVYSMFASVLSEYADSLETHSQSRVAHSVASQRKCDSYFIIFIGFFIAVALALMAAMAAYPPEYDNQSRFESATSGKPGEVLHLLMFVAWIMSDYLYLLHVLVPWRQCVGRGGTEYVRQCRDRAHEMAMEAVAVPSTASLGGLGVTY